MGISVKTIFEKFTKIWKFCQKLHLAADPYSKKTKIIRINALRLI